MSVNTWNFDSPLSCAVLTLIVVGWSIFPLCPLISQLRYWKKYSGSSMMFSLSLWLIDMMSEYFFQYCSWLISGHKGKILHPTTIKVSTAQLIGESKSHVFTDIVIVSYIIPIQCNVQMINDSKAHAKGFGLVIIKIPPKTLVYPSGHHIICHGNHKTQSVKLNSNITMNSETLKLKLSDGCKWPQILE